LNRDLLLKKLEIYGVRGSALDWFASYLGDRTQRTSITKTGLIFKSKVSDNKYGVPQGSILGPVLFIVYVNDLHMELDSSRDYSITQYADDTNLLVRGKNLDQLCDRAETLLFVTDLWFSKNNLYLNREKTSAVLFRSKLNKIVVPESLNINGNQIELNSATKFLGVNIDEFLDWSENIERLGVKLNKACYCIRDVKKYLEPHALRTLYFANFENVMRYGIIFWAPNSSAQSIFVIQKRIIRVICNVSFANLQGSV